MKGPAKTAAANTKARRPERSSFVKSRDAFALAGLAILIVVGGVLALGYDEVWITGSGMDDWIDGIGNWGPVAIVALMVLHSFIPFPAEFVALCAGAAFGTLFGSALVWTGAMIGASLSFWLARLLGRTAIERHLPVRYRSAVDDWADDQGAITLLISRFVPVIAFNLINYAAGLTRISWWTFIWTTSIGILPLTVLMAYLGARMTELSWPYLLASSAGGIVVIWALHRFGRKCGWFQIR
jgi:uncharacterized membrane protein YdjX (TVP38/TMEM64 family)